MMYVDQEAVKDRDATTGEQLHQPPGERLAPGRGASRRTAVPRSFPAVLPRQLLPHPRIRPIGSAEAHLYFLPQQPEENGEQKMSLTCKKSKIFKPKKLYFPKNLYNEAFQAVWGHFGV